MLHLFFILFLFILGACIGSFLNVVVWRLPRGQSLVSPPSHCPKCDHRLAWYDNVPVLGWIMLRGRCRYCGQPIAMRYPLVEAATGLLFVFYYVMFFMAHIGPCAPATVALPNPNDPWGAPLAGRIVPMTILEEWPTYALAMFLVCSLLAASLIDGELFIIPLEIPWLMAAVGIAIHAIFDTPALPGALIPLGPGAPTVAAMAAGGGVGLLVSILLWWRGWLPASFQQGDPSLEIDMKAYEAEVEKAKAAGVEAPAPPVVYTRAEIRAEMNKEILFLLPPLVGAILWAALAYRIPALHTAWASAVQPYWVGGLLGSVLGALVGGLVVWTTRILGSIAFGREAMGMGDVHLMFGVGAIVGAAAATVSFFLAPFAGAAIGLYMLLTRRQREMPYGPYLSLASAAVLLCYCPIADRFGPGLTNLAQMLRSLLGGA